MTLTEFILARIEEDEAAAQECAKLFPPPWEIADRGWQVRIYSANVPLSEDVGEPGDERTPCVIEVEPTYAHDGWLSDNVVHIARHDPARVLAECAAKRELVAIAVDQIRLGREARGWDNWEDMANQTLRALASIWSDHPDYRPEEWA